MAEITGSPRVYAPTGLALFTDEGKLRGAFGVTITDPADVDDHDARVLYLRNMTNLTGKCPECGAVLTRPNRRQRRLAAAGGVNLVVRVYHEDGCPASDVNVRDVGSGAASC
jgi:hypothetical protein